MPPVRSAAQQSRLRTASRIKKAYRWKSDRRNTRPRGFEDIGSNCYRIAVLQTLLHLPRFVNWIREHRAPGKHWDCNPTDPNRQQPVGDVILESLGPHATGCVPCLLKRLITAYWGRYRLSPDGSPLPFDHNDPAIRSIHDLAERHFCTDPDGWSDNLKEMFGKKDRKYVYDTWSDNLKKRSDKEDRSYAYDGRTEKEIEQKMDDLTRQARKTNQTDQHDADEFLRYILDGVEWSYDPTNTPHGARRRRQYNSLFSLTRQEHRTCANCHERYIAREREELGLFVTPDTSGTDTVEAAIDRTMHERLDDVRSSCALECKETSLDCEFRLHATPEYLRVHLNVRLGEWNEAGAKNRALVHIPEILDLTQYMTTPPDDPSPVRYRLVSAVYHRGTSLSAGHYAAGVTSGLGGPTGSRAADEENNNRVQFFCNDRVITEWVEPTTVANKLTINPLNFSTRMNTQSDSDPYILWYVREPHVEVRGAAPVAVVVPVVVGYETIADRIRKAPRVRRRPKRS